jgi:dTDP-4-amino-4,6-dideoxygalactose transaminase
MTNVAPLRRDVAVPLLDLGPSHRELREGLLADLAALLDSGEFVNGPEVDAFEAAFAAYCGAALCAGVASGLDALRLALLAAGVGPGDEVIVPAHTFMATWEAVTQAGAVPVPVDVTEVDYGLDPAAAAAAIGKRTRAIVPVHLYGQLADVRALRQLADGAAIALVEDACQAHGARRAGVGAGTLGDAAAFSFYPGKNLGALGDAGAVVTSDAEIDRRVRVLREHGQQRKHEHVREGWTARLDTIQAAALLRKLPSLDRWNEERRAAAGLYAEALEGLGDLVLPPIAADSEPVWHVYAIRTAEPEALAAALRESGVATGRHYPRPPHLLPAYARLGLRRGAFPVAESVCDEVLSLPLFPGITASQQHYVVEAIDAYFARG